MCEVVYLILRPSFIAYACIYILVNPYNIVGSHLGLSLSCHIDKILYQNTFLIDHGKRGHTTYPGLQHSCQQSENLGLWKLVFLLRKTHVVILAKEKTYCAKLFVRIRPQTQTRPSVSRSMLNLDRRNTNWDREKSEIFKIGFVATIAKAGWSGDWPVYSSENCFDIRIL